MQRLAVLSLIILASLRAQNISGTISGVVSDTSGAVVPGASVRIVNSTTNVLAWSGASDSHGGFLAPMLNVGAYNIAVESKGFKKFEILAMPLEFNQRARVDAVLAPGEVREVVTVTGEGVAVLNKEDSAVGIDIDPSAIRDIPLANRDIFNLLNLSGGVSAGGDATAIVSSQYSVNGGRTQASEITIDGVSVVGGTTGSTVHIPDTEALREVKILTSTYSAEFGRTSGATIASVIDSGANRPHGGAYEYFKNEDLDANNFFNNLRGTARPYDRKNQFGGKLSGPVYLPRLYNGRDRTFFFFNYEEVRTMSPTLNISTLPPQKFYTGDFSTSPVPVGDPLAKQVPFPGNKIPSSRLDPAAQKILGLLPTPNSIGSYDSTTGLSANNYVNQVFTQPTNGDLNVRVDHNLSSANRLFARFTHYSSLTPEAPIIDGVFNTGNGPSRGSDYQAVLGLTSSITPTLILDLRGSVVRDTLFQNGPSLGFNQQSALGIQRSPFDAAPSLAITGFTTFGSQGNTWVDQANNIFQYAGSLSWVHGKHMVKAGAQFRRAQYNFFNAAANFAGLYSFTGEITATNTTAGNAVNALADFLLGDVKSSAYSIPQPMIGRRGYNLGFYIQDDWKITSKLTLNLGLRDEYESPMTTSNGMFSRVDPATGQMLVAGKNASASLNLSSPKFNFGPRVGLAYALDPKTVVRSAFGIFYYQLFANLGGVLNFTGYTLNQSYNSLGRGVPQAFSLSQGMPLPLVQNFNPLQVMQAATPSSPLSPSGFYSDISHLPENLQWNFGIQREIARGTVAEATYVGSHAYHLPLYIRDNVLPSFEVAQMLMATDNNVQTQLYRPFPNLAAWSQIRNVGDSEYDSLQLRISRELSRSLSVMANYTFSKSMDDGSGTFTNTQPSNTVDSGQLPQIALNLEHAPSVFDRRHSFMAAPRYTISNGPRWIRNIDFSGVFIARSGLPVNIYQNNLYPDAVQQRPNITGTASLLYAPQEVTAGTGIRYLRPTTDPQFPLTPTGPLFITVSGKSVMVLPAAIGNLGREIARAPGDWNLNLSAGRRFRIREKLSMQVRAETYNTFNHTNLLMPASNLSVIANTATQTAIFNSPGYGLITSARSARFMQMVARFEF
jgi:hypothetical protein